jgi:hypothetical protein
MRRVASFLLVAGLVVCGAQRAHATPTSSDPRTAARDAAAWLAGQVNDQGFVPSSTDPKAPNLSVTVQAVEALAAAGVGRTTVDEILAYLGKHIDDYVIQSGVVSPGAIADLILAVRAAGVDPTSFGSPPENLVTRLLSTQQSNGLFGTSDARFDGAFRQGFSLLALAAVEKANADGVAWLEDQQCADGLWTAYRADIAQPCGPPDPVNFTGPDTNSTAAAMLGLTAQGQTTPATAGAAALEKVRTPDGGWAFIAVSSGPTDSDSTGLVVEALQTLEHTTDAQGLAAILALQVGCDADPADRGGIAFESGSGPLAPDAFATSQAIAAVAEAALPVTDATIESGVPTPCVSPTTTTVSVAPQGSTSTTTTVAAGAGSSSDELPRTGSSSAPPTVGAILLAATGCALVAGARRRSR